MFSTEKRGTLGGASPARALARTIAAAPRVSRLHEFMSSCRTFLNGQMRMVFPFLTEAGDNWNGLSQRSSGAVHLRVVGGGLWSKTQPQRVADAPRVSTGDRVQATERLALDVAC